MATPKTPEEIKAAMQAALEAKLNKTADWLKFHHVPKGPHHGQHRRTSPTAYRDPAKQSSSGDDGADALIYPWSPYPLRGACAVYASQTGLGPSVSATDIHRIMQQAMEDMVRQAMMELSSPPPIPYAGIRTGEIIGYRAWYVTYSGFLRSLAHDFAWPPGKIITGDVNECVANHYRPIYGGVYCFKSPDLDREIMREFHAFAFGTANIFTRLSMALGTIEIWGDVVEHETGYRASHAKLRSIDHVAGIADIDCLRKEYGLE